MTAKWLCAGIVMSHSPPRIYLNMRQGSTLHVPGMPSHIIVLLQNVCFVTTSVVKNATAGNGHLPILAQGYQDDETRPPYPSWSRERKKEVWPRYGGEDSSPSRHRGGHDTGVQSSKYPFATSPPKVTTKVTKEQVWLCNMAPAWCNIRACMCTLCNSIIVSLLPFRTCQKPALLMATFLSWPNHTPAGEQTRHAFLFRTIRSRENSRLKTGHHPGTEGKRRDSSLWSQTGVRNCHLCLYQPGRTSAERSHPLRTLRRNGYSSQISY